MVITALEGAVCPQGAMHGLPLQVLREVALRDTIDPAPPVWLQRITAAMPMRRWGDPARRDTIDPGLLVFQTERRLGSGFGWISVCNKDPTDGVADKFWREDILPGFREFSIGNGGSEGCKVRKYSSSVGFSEGCDGLVKPVAVAEIAVDCNRLAGASMGAC